MALLLLSHHLTVVSGYCDGEAAPLITIVYDTKLFLVNIVYHCYYIFIIAITRYCIYDSSGRKGRLLGTVDASHRYGGLEQGSLNQDATLLQLLVGDGHNPLLDNGGLGFDVHRPC